MPQDNNTLLAQLLRNSQSIGPQGTSTPLPNDLGMENQQPDPINTVMGLAGDPLQNSAPGAAAPPLGAEGKLYDLIRGGWSDLRPAVTTGKPIETLLGMFRKFKPPLAQATEDVVPEAAQKAATGFKVPETTFMKSPAPGALDYPHEMPMKRSPDIRERQANQSQAAARESRNPVSTPEGLKKPIKASQPIQIPSQAKPGLDTKGNLYYRDYWQKISKPSVLMVRSIRTMEKGGVSPEEITKKFPKLPPATLQKILNKDIWAWVK